MNKKELREQFKTRRQLLSLEEISELSDHIFLRLTSSFNFKDKTVHTFFSITSQKEIVMKKINQFLLSNAKIVGTSITKFSPLTLIHSKFDKHTKFELDKYNIPIPSKILPIKESEFDIVLIPLLSFDTQGSRIGYGKGLYDSFLAKCNPDCIKIGLSLFEPSQLLIPIETHDIKLDFCVTPFTSYSFTEKHQYKNPD